MSLLDDENIVLNSSAWDDFKASAILDGIKDYLKTIKNLRYSFNVCLDNMLTMLNRENASLTLDISEIGYGKRYFVGYDFLSIPGSNPIIKFKLFDSDKYPVKTGIRTHYNVAGEFEYKVQDTSKKNTIGNYKIFSVFKHQPRIHKTDHPMALTHKVLGLGINDTRGGWLTYTIEDLVNKTTNERTVELKEYEPD